LIELLHLATRTHRVYRELGRVAELCPICHEIQPHRLHSLRQFHTVGMYAPQMELEVQMDARCTVCGAQAPRAAHSLALG
jgi:hypothetical protein